MSADFTPSLQPYKETGSFRFWCQKVLPLVYDDSLNYYELLCKVVNYLNDVISNVDGLHQDVVNLTNAFNQLQDYVTNYFDNLDVQDEINNKLDEMVSDGTFETILSKISNYAYITVKPLSEISGDVTEYLKDIFNTTNSTIVFPKTKDTYVITEPLTLNDGMFVYGNGCSISCNELIADSGIINLNGDNIHINGLTLIGNMDNSLVLEHTYDYTSTNGMDGIRNSKSDVNNIHIKNCIFKKIGKMGVVINTNIGNAIEVDECIFEYTNRDGTFITANNVYIHDNIYVNCHDNSIALDASYGGNYNFINYSIYNNTIYPSIEYGTEFNGVDFTARSSQCCIFIKNKENYYIKNINIFNNIGYGTYNSIDISNAQNVKILNNYFYTRGVNNQANGYVLNNVDCVIKNNKHITQSSYLVLTNSNVSINNDDGTFGYVLNLNNTDVTIYDSVFTCTGVENYNLSNILCYNCVFNGNSIVSTSTNTVYNSFINDIPIKYLSNNISDVSTTYIQISSHYDVSILNITTNITNLNILGFNKTEFIAIINNNDSNTHTISGTFGSIVNGKTISINANSSITLYLRKTSYNNYAICGYYDGNIVNNV